MCQSALREASLFARLSAPSSVAAAKAFASGLPVGRYLGRSRHCGGHRSGAGSPGRLEGPLISPCTLAAPAGRPIAFTWR